MKRKSIEMPVSEFKARCLAVFSKLDRRQYARVVVTRHGKPVAEVTPPRSTPPDLWGALRGSVRTPKGIDLTAPVLTGRLDARAGKLHR
ncbi:MAG: type II toxin-antitoxin system Phd/YefM family antitoxin [Actinomycetota bacterium]